MVMVTVYGSGRHGSKVSDKTQGDYAFSDSDVLTSNNDNDYENLQWFLRSAKSDYKGIIIILGFQFFVITRVITISCNNNNRTVTVANDR